MPRAPASLRLLVNGEVRTLPAPATVADLVRELGLQPAQVAVERNQQLVRRAEQSTTPLADGDRLEVVTFFGGG
ncbi:MAG TPA: sulfur carrier protein ThiS [Planctomycetota bacterium]|nr:sulfur carrier protein ThiS [Planctomycetota bacterium]